MAPGSGPQAVSSVTKANLSFPLLLLLLSWTACASSGSFRNGVYEAPGVLYRVEAPTGWEFLSFAGNDLAWGGPEGEVIAVNSECRDHGDPSLVVLTNHLLIGFEDRRVVEREELRLAGRGALRTHLKASLDGLPVEMELTVLKKDGCVYDLTYLAPPSRFDANLATYRRLVASFDAPGRR